jgi:hypothetical protein
MVYVARETEKGELEAQYPVARFVPVKVRVYKLPGVEEEQWEVIVEDRAGDRFQVEGTFEEVLARLKPYATHPHFRRVFSTILLEMEEKDLVERRSVYHRPGIYLTDDGLECVGEWVGEEPSEEELRAALELLDELATHWFNAGRFAKVIRWGVVAPLSFAVKQAGEGWIPWLYLEGQARCGKTTLGEIVLNLWGVPDNSHYVDTKAQLCAVLESGTLPILINELHGLFGYDSNVEVMKRAVESTVSREVCWGWALKRELALAPVVFTSTRELPEDTGLRRKFVVVRFPTSDRITPDLERRFNREVRPRLEELSALGRWLARRFVEEGRRLLRRVGRDWEAVARELLEEAYRAAGLEPPGWLGAEPEDEEDPEQEAMDGLTERVRAFIVRTVNRSVRDEVGKLRERVELALREGRLPYALLRRREGQEYVLITTELPARLRELGVEVPGGLKGLAELLGWEYTAARVHGRVRRVARVPLEEFLEFLGSTAVEHGEEGAGPGERARERVLDLLRELALEYPDGVPEPILLERAREEGLDESEAREAVRELVNEGRVAVPTSGVYLPLLSGEEVEVFRRFFREYLRAWAGESKYDWEAFLDEAWEITEELTGASEEVIQRVLNEVKRLGTLSVPPLLTNLAEEGASEEELVQAMLPRPRARAGDAESPPTRRPPATIPGFLALATGAGASPIDGDWAIIGDEIERWWGALRSEWTR